MFRVRPLTLVLVAVALCGVQLLAAPVTVRLATIVPRNSLWYNALTDMLVGTIDCSTLGSMTGT